MPKSENGSNCAIDISLNFIIGISFVAAFIRGFRMPNLWTMNYFITNYFDGFYRRSLLGTFLYPFGDLRFNYHFIVGIEALIFILLCIVVLFVTYRANRNFKWLMILFLLAPTGGYLFHEIGYVDQLLFLVFLLAYRSKSTLISNGLLLASLFIHEMALFTIIPLYCASRVHQGVRWQNVVKTAFICLAGFGLIALFLQTSLQANIDAFLDLARSKANYIVRYDYYEIFSNLLTGQRQKIYYRNENLIELILMLPMWVLCGLSFIKNGSDCSKKILWLCGFMACFSPILLGIFAWDTHRWVFLSLSQAMVCFYLARNTLTDNMVKAITIVFVLFIALGNLDYFDDYVPRSVNTEKSISYFFQYELKNLIKTIPGQ